MLNPKQFFHGTRAPLQEGDLVVPGSMLSNERSGRNSGKVWAADHEPVAWGYASTDQGEGPQQVAEVEFLGDEPEAHEGLNRTLHSGDFARVKRMLPGPKGAQLRLFPDEEGRMYKPVHERSDLFSEIY